MQVAGPSHPAYALVMSALRELSADGVVKADPAGQEMLHLDTCIAGSVMLMRPVDVAARVEAAWASLHLALVQLGSQH